MGHPLAFYTLAFLCAASALGVILARHPVYAVLGLVAALCALSGLFLLLGAVFVAMIQILIYAGAILVLFLFVVMLLDLAPERLFQIRANILRFTATLLSLFFLWQLLGVTGAFAPAAKHAAPLIGLPASLGSAQAGTTQAIGSVLFTTYALPFEVASLLLLVGIIGAVVLAKKRL
jgi:NADH-quinone oxidoreductase subunit J